MTFDTQELAMVDWPQEDLIRWVQWRVRAFEVSRENKSKGWGNEPPDHPLSEQDLRIWLSKFSDGMSLTEIARNKYSRFWQKAEGKSGKNQGPISLVRRAIDRVERFLNRNGDDFVYPKKSKRRSRVRIKRRMPRRRKTKSR
jgi:hypothetical protein